MKKNTISLILRLPAEMLLLGVLFASFYIKFTEKNFISWATPIIFLVVVILYFLGRNIKKGVFDF